MSDLRADFDARVQRLVCRHQAMSRGCKVSLRPDGLILREPRRLRRRLSRRGVVLLAALIGAAGASLAALVPENEHASLILKGGALPERAAAIARGVDTLSRLAADTPTSWEVLAPWD